MTSSALNEFMKLVLKNRDFIDSAYFFDEVSDYHVQGIEVRLKKADMVLDFTGIDSYYLRTDPFKKDVRYYVYIIIGYGDGYKKWYNMQIEGKVATRVLNKYPEMWDGKFDEANRADLEAFKETLTQELLAAHPA